MITAFVHRLPQRLIDCYRGYRFVWHVIAALLTAILVVSGTDAWVAKEVQGMPLIVIFVAGIGGFFVPIVLSVGLYGLGEWWGSANHMNIAARIAQASVAALLISSFYKVFTGRTPPEFLYSSGQDLSRDFHFGILQHGVFWGWPSSHAAVAIAGATVLYLLWPDIRVRSAAVLWAAVVAIGALGFHWFSDVVAGVIIGISVGAAIAWAQ